MKKTNVLFGGMDAAVTNLNWSLQSKLQCKKSARMRISYIIVLVAIIGFTIVACGGGDNPKSLAKQTYQVFTKVMAAEGEEPSELAFVLWLMSEPPELQKLMEKAEALSESGQKAYQEELEKLLEGK
jgi:hypothetical protein